MIKMEKSEIRRIMKQKRRALTEDEILEKSKAISESLFKTKEFTEAKTVMIYMSSFGEVSTATIMQRLFESGRRVVVPISNTADETITLSYIESRDELISGAYGIPEPKTVKPVHEEDISLVLVPGTAFDMQMNRMGFGKGYYDKLLERLSAIKVGLCYDFQLLSEIPHSAHDIPMDIIITEERIISNAF